MAAWTSNISVTTVAGNVNSWNQLNLLDDYYDLTQAIPLTGNGIL